MAMLISKFHGLIRSRILLFGFLIIIVFTFVIWGTTWPSQSRRAREANAAGILDGRPVSLEEFRKAYFHAYMSIVLSFGRPIDISPALDQELRRSAWTRLASLREAERVGLTASDEEVVAAIQAHPGFNVSGRFSPAQYQAFIQNVLARMGFNERQFEEHVREEISLQKLQHLLQQAILVAPADIHRAIETLSDIFEVDYVAITAKDVEKEVQVTEDDARTLFLQDPARFTLPEKVRVRYVEVPISNYLAQVNVPEEDAMLYYDDHAHEFITTNRVRLTNAVSAQPEADNAVQGWTNEVVTLPFDQVKTGILQRLTFRAARDKAVEAATELAIQLAPDREGRAPTFEEAADQAGWPVKTVGPFARQQRVPEVDAGLEFNRAAFLLRNTPDEYFSDAVVGSNAVYVLALDEQIPSRVPEFDEVSEDVMSVAREQAIREAVTRKAQTIREAALTALKEGRSFTDAIQSFEMHPVRVGPFTLAEGLGEAPYADELSRNVLPLNEGEVSELVEARGATLILYVAKRKAGDMASLEAARDQIVNSIRSQRGRTLFGEWQRYLVRKGILEDRTARPEEEEAGPERAAEEAPSGPAGETPSAPEE